MSNLTLGQIIMDAQRMASRVKDLELLGNTLLVEAEGNNRLVESMRQFQDDMEILNRLAHNKSNMEMVNRIQQQNATSSEILKENRELKVCIEDYERAIELIMQKYREHANSKVLESKINFKEVYNEKLWKIIREQREKINEMAAVMQRAANADDEAVNRDIEIMARLRLENQTLRELLQISKQFGTASRPIRANEYLLEEKSVQTDADDSADELSLSGASIENANNNSVIYLNTSNTISTTAVTATATATGGAAAGAANTTSNTNINSNTAETNSNATSSETSTLLSNENNNVPRGDEVTISFMAPISSESMDKITITTNTGKSTGPGTAVTAAAAVASLGNPSGVGGVGGVDGTTKTAAASAT